MHQIMTKNRGVSVCMCVCVGGGGARRKDGGGGGGRKGMGVRAEIRESSRAGS